MTLPRFLALLIFLPACGPDVVTDRMLPPAQALQAVAATPGGPDGPPVGDPAPLDTATRVVKTGLGAPTPLPAQPAAEPIGAVLYSEHDVEVRSRIAGVLEAIHVELGDRLEAGALLALMDDREESALLAAAEAATDLARSRHDRSAALAEQEMITRDELDEAIYHARASEASLREAAVRLSWTRVRAPFAGVVARRFVRPGQWVEEGQPLFRVTALAPLRALVRVPEPQARFVVPGAPALVAGPEGSVVEGRVARISPAVDPLAGTVEVLVDVPAPGSLRPGTSVSVRFLPTR